MGMVYRFLALFEAFTPAFWQRFGKSKVVDRLGQPLMVFHGTTKAFDEIDNSAAKGIGTHFGTTAQASYCAGAPAKNKRPLGWHTPNSRVYPCYLRIENPAKLYDCGFNAAWTVLMHMEDSPREILPPEEIMRLEQITKNLPDKEGIDIVKDALKAHGYDGVVYRNLTREGKGRSWIVFDNDQIIPTYCPAR